MKATTVYAPAAECYTLKSALLVYHSTHGDVHVSSHGIQRAPGSGPQIGAGKPLGQKEIDRILAALASKARRAGVRGWVDANLLYFSPHLLAWWRPAAPACVFFDKPPGKKSKLSAGSTPQPALVFAVREGRWYVWAVTGNDRPTPGTLLHQAPYYNVDDDGRICTGNAELPATLAPATIPGFERAFFDSRFTHMNAPRICQIDGAILWAGLLSGRYTAFPESVLLATDATLGATLDRLSGDPS